MHVKSVCKQSSIFYFDLYLIFVNNTPVRFEFVFNLTIYQGSISNIDINKYELKLKVKPKYNNRKKQQKLEGQRDYLQDLYGTPELTMTELQVNNYDALKTEFKPKEQTYRIYSLLRRTIFLRENLAPQLS